MKDEAEGPGAGRTRLFALRVIKMFSALPKSDVARVLGRQVLRSGTSVGANYREAQRARSKAEFIAKIGDCLKELDETSYWLELLAESGTVSAPKLASLQDECEQLLAFSPRFQTKSYQANGWPNGDWLVNLASGLGNPPPSLRLQSDSPCA